MWSKVLLAAGMLAPAFAQTCTYSISPASNPSVPAGGGSFGPVSVTTLGTNCRWTAVSNVSWMDVSYGRSGSGNGTFGYGVEPNNGVARTGTITAAGQTYTVMQAGCTFSFNPAQAKYPFGGGTGSFSVTPSLACTWTPNTTSDWIRISSGPGGPGSGTVSYSVVANDLPSVRVGNITVGAQSFPITQDAAPCTTTLTPATATVVAGGGIGTFRVNVTPSGCEWRATSASTFITVTSGGSGKNSGIVGYSAAANTLSERRGSITVNDQSFNITQDGSACLYTATADKPNFGVQGGSSAVTITTSGGCQWTATSTAGWILFPGASSGTGPTRLNFTVAANTGAPRNGTMTVAGQTIAIAQEGLAVPAPQLSSVVNAARYGSGAISAGEIVTLRGSTLGPDPLVTMQTTADGLGLTTMLAGTRVLFDGVAAPMVYTWGPQVSAIAPFGIDGKTSTRVQVEYQGVLSNAVTMDVAPAAPGIFSLDASGTGQGAVLNQDFSVNGPSNPATIGSVVQIFTTGGGQTNPAGADGKFVGATLPRLILPVAVRIGGLDSSVQYSGGAPGLVAGVVQVNAVVPDGVQTGDAVPIVVQVGNASSQDGVTIAIRAQ